MPDLRPFRALRYDAARVPDLGAVICPPYDVISAQQRDALLLRDPYNAVRLELPAPTTDTATHADLRRAAATLRDWSADGTLRRDERPMVYVYEQRFVDADGAPRRARGVFCELRLENYGPGSGVRPHERTLAAPREHRFALLSETRTHLSPVLLVYDDADAECDELLDQISTGPSRTGSDGNVEHKMWAVDPDASEAARTLIAAASRRPLTIADGHHRYETALRYRDTAEAPPGADHVLALLYGSGSGGLLVAPWHRILSAVPDPAAMLAMAESLFAAQPVAGAEELRQAVADSDEPGVLGVWTRAGGLLLRVERERVHDLLSDVSSIEVRWLDVSVLSGTLKPMTDMDEAALSASGRLTYTHDDAVAVDAVERAAADVCFLLRPTPIEQVLAVAAAGDFMPAKSTYFYPKAATGLVFDPLAP